MAARCTANRGPTPVIVRKRRFPLAAHRACCSRSKRGAASAALEAEEHAPRYRRTGAVQGGLLASALQSWEDVDFLDTQDEGERPAWRGAAVEHFAHWHAHGVARRGGVYRHPVPIRPPRTGEQYAFEVDLDACTGCKACVTACHALNGLDPGEAWRQVTLLVGQKDDKPLLQHVTSSCHHCASPACLQGCPANAYVKDEATGIVRHLDDACIGCRYCTFTCPYGAPQYVSRLGIVRKCDLCIDRLAAGEAPACVQGCPNDAIRVRLVSFHEIQAQAVRGDFLPNVAPPHQTQPASVYRRSRWRREPHVADFEVWRPEEAHWPLAVMLVLTQLAFGAFAVGELVQRAGVGPAPGEAMQAAVSFGAATLALSASVLHLGRPLLAWRAVLGIGHSWLSREVVAFALFAGLAALAAAAAQGWLPTMDASLRAALDLAVVAAGGAGVLASVVLYHRTRRPSWHGLWVAPRFFLTTVSLGSATTLLCLVGAEPAATATAIVRACGAAVAVSTALELLLEGAQIAAGYRHGRSPLARSARLLFDVLYPWTVVRVALGWFGGVVLPLLVFVPLPSGHTPPVAAALVMAVLVLAAGLTERSLFFRAGVPATEGGRAA